MPKPLSGLINAILFCALSLLLAELISTLMTALGIISITDEEVAKSLFMVAALFIYLLITPSDTDDEDNQ